MRGYLAALALVGSFAFAGCSDGASSPTKTPRATTSAPAASRTSTPRPTPTRSASTATPPAETSTPVPATSTPAPAGDSGIEGLVTIGPTCPVQRIDSPCPDRPYEAAVIVLDGNRRKVAEVRSDADGRFRVLLPPGAYTLSPQSPGILPRAGEQTVTVVPGMLTSVMIQYDSGIR